MAWRFGQLNPDPDAYRLLAENLAQHKVLGSVDADGNEFPTAFRPPGYPWLLSWFVFDDELASLSVAELHVVLGFLTIAITYNIGRQLMSARCGLVAALLVAIDPILLGQSSLVMTETVSTFLAALVWWLFLKSERELNARSSPWRLLGWALATGLALAAGYLCRPVFIVWAGLTVAMLAFYAISRDRQRLWIAVGICGVLAVAVSLWTYRNMKAMGKPIWATTHGGYTLLLGNNPSFYDYLRSGKFGEKWDAEFFHGRWAARTKGDPTSPDFWLTTSKFESPKSDVSQQERERPPSNEQARIVRLSEIEDDALAYATAKATIQREPRMFLYSSLVRLGRLWSPMPHVGDHPILLRYSIGLYYGMLMLAIAYGVWRLGRSLLSPGWMMMLLLAVALSGVHSIYWSNMRMRSLATPLLAMLASASCCSRIGKPELAADVRPGQNGETSPLNGL